MKLIITIIASLEMVESRNKGENASQPVINFEKIYVYSRRNINFECSTTMNYLQHIIIALTLSHQ